MRRGLCLVARSCLSPLRLGTVRLVPLECPRSLGLQVPGLPGNLCLGEEVDGDDEAVEAEDLCEDEDEDHADEEARLLRRPPHAGVAHDADGVAGRQSRQAHSQTGTQVKEAPATERKLIKTRYIKLTFLVL